MGGGHYEDKNDVSSGYTPDDIAHGNVPDPGKRTKTMGKTGVPIIDEGLACDADHANGVGAACTLSTTQRQTALGEFTRRVERSRDAFLNACTTVEVHKLLETEQDISPILMFVLNALGTFLLSSMANALMGFKASLKKDPMAAMVFKRETDRIERLTNPVTLGDSVANPASLKEKVLDKFEGLNETKMEAKFDTSIDKAKDFAKGYRKKGQEGEARSEKDESLEYLGSFRTVGQVTFENFATDLPAGATDVELVGYINAFSIDAHNVDAYVKAITEKLERFKKSQVTKVGRRNATHFVSNGETDLPDGDAVRDVKVRWQTYISGSPNELVFVYQDGVRDGAGFHTDDPDSPDFKKTGPKEFGPHNPMGGAKAGVGPKHDDPFKVDPEFWDVALERHRAIWKSEPETVLVDDSSMSYAYDPKRQMAAKNQKYKIAQMQATAERTAALAHEQQQAMEAAKKAQQAPTPTPDIFKRVLDSRPQHDPPGDPFK